MSILPYDPIPPRTGSSKGDLDTRRYRWFGERATCWMPAGELHDRFLDAQLHGDVSEH